MSDAPDAEPEIVEVEVPAGVSNERADKVLARFFPGMSRSQVQVQFEAGGVTRGGEVLGKSARVRAGEVLEFTRPEAPPPVIEPVPMGLDILYEDGDLVAVNKPAGLVTHPGAATQAATLAHALLYHTGGRLARAGGEARPGVVHRLDRETSGVIVFAKSEVAYHSLVQAFSARELEKRYLALCAGVPELESGVMREPIGRNPANRTRMRVSEHGRAARTDWKVLERFGAAGASLLGLRLHTGRTHQIRVHLAHRGWPILGDVAYGYRAGRHACGVPAPRVMLHAASLALAHPVTGEALAIEAPLPGDFRAARERLGAGGG